VRNFRKHKTIIFIVTLTLVVAALIGIFGAVTSNETAGFAENAVGVTAEGGQTLTCGIGSWFRNIFSYFGSVKKLREENEALKKMNIELSTMLY
jgi:cell shape-determining protein MreC